VLNTAETARECQVKRKRCEGYFAILDDLLVGVRIPVFLRRAKRRMVRHPKFYFFDTGIFRALRPRGPLDRPEEIDGAALETLVLQNLHAVLNWQFAGAKLHYWRTSNGTKVDFIAYGESLFVAIEIKRKRPLARRDLSGLRAFRRDYPEARACVFYGGDRELEIEGIRALPIAEALMRLPEVLMEYRVDATI